jgi:hypothetical protein
MKTIALALASVCCLQPVCAMDRGTTELGRSYMSGGVGAEEMSALNAERGQYALAILTASKGSGAFLGDVHIRITDEQSRQVLDTVMDGPWLLVDLPAGRYQVEADHAAVVKKSTVALGASGHQQTVFYFDTHDEVEDLTP